jgi:hypothetical protein
MEYLILICIIWLHFFADFFLQSDKVALNKSTKIQYLLLHCFIYYIPFLLIGLNYAILNTVLHFGVDYFSSKATSYLWQKEKRHWFFVVIGLDQAMHMTCLIVTMEFMIL